jgi:excinuclease ABC subunit C
MKPDELIHDVRLLPEQPGVYLFYGKSDNLLYVGKARNLRKRVTSYFNRTAGLNRKTRKLLSETQRIEFTVSASEFDALLLENNLIKQHQPKYNILLKDDKTYPYLCITREHFPRIIYTRKYDPQQGEYFGPYSSVAAVKAVLDLVRKLYTIRTCNLVLSPNNIRSGKFKVCLEYHIGNCKGPCEALQSEEEYDRDIGMARQVLKGNLSVVRQHFQEAMQKAAADLEFEKAQLYKEKIELLDRFQSKSVIVNKNLSDIDVLAVMDGNEYAYVSYLQVKEGAIVFSRTVEIQKKLNESPGEIASLMLLEFRDQARSTNPKVISNLPIDVFDQNVKNTVPRSGDKKKLIDFALKTAGELMQQRQLLRAEIQSRVHPAVQALQESLALPQAPVIVECFDNSNLFGKYPVAAMVRFVNGKPDKKNYRHYNLKTVEGINDFASMEEVVYRRYKRLMEERGKLPDLIIIDGGKGQLSSAYTALSRLGLSHIPMIGIAKRLEEIYRVDDTLPIHLNKKSPALKLIQQIRDEAHRFAISFHRKKRTASFLESKLNNIAGVGKKTLETLRRHFKTIKALQETDEGTLAKIVGNKKATLILREIKKPPESQEA